MVSLQSYKFYRMGVKAEARGSARLKNSFADKRTVVKNPLSPAEHPGGIGVDCESFELGLDQFVVWISRFLLDRLAFSEYANAFAEWNFAGMNKKEIPA